jgi:nitroreductase
LIELLDRLGAVLPDNGVAKAPHQGSQIKTEPGQHEHDTTRQAGRRRHRYLQVRRCPTVAPDQATLPSNVSPMQGYGDPAPSGSAPATPCAMLSRQHTEDAIMNDLFDIMQTTRSMRRLKPDPVPDELIRKILEAGSCAANGGNTQRWRFLVLKDPKIKQAVQAWYKKAFDEVVGPRYASSAPPPGVSPERYKRQHSAVEYLTDHFHEAPVWIVACIDEGKTEPTRWSGASIYPAVQNMLLATRALGLGSTLTTRHLLYAKEAEAAMGLPEGVHSYAILPIGYPMGNFGPVGRGKLAEIVYQDKWGQPYAAMN